MKQKPDIIFCCKKCGHRIYVSTRNKSIYDMAEVLDTMDCPDCGSEFWIYDGLGDYETEYAAAFDPEL